MMADLSHELHHAGRKDEDGGENHEHRTAAVLQPVRHRVAVELRSAYKDLTALHDSSDDTAQEKDDDADLHEQLRANRARGKCGGVKTSESLESFNLVNQLLNWQMERKCSSQPLTLRCITGPW